MSIPVVPYEAYGSVKKESYSDLIKDKPKPVKQKQKMAKKVLNLDIPED